MVTARAPGRVVLIGDHTDYTGGLVCAMAVDRWTVVDGERGGERLTLASDADPDVLDVVLPVHEPGSVRPAWGRYVMAVWEAIGASDGFTGTVSSTLPIGGGLSSSAALEVATALALGYSGDHRSLALACQRAEHRATGLPSGVLDQVVSLFGMAGHALVLNCTSLTVDPVQLPSDAAVQVRFVAERRLVGSPYAERVAQVAAAETVIGPLRLARPGDESAIEDPVLRRRARHVLTENQRVRDFASALRANDLATAGAVMVQGHASLRDDYDVSTPTMDAAVDAWNATGGVYGVRMSGGGFGGCIVALTDPDVVLDGAWLVTPVEGAAVTLR
jgi:galactokinase